MAKILIVGAGAVGSVYGHALQKGGFDVSFLVKPKHVPEREHGIHLYTHRLGRKHPRHELWREFRLIDGIEKLPAEPFDFVMVTVPSNALHSGDWLPHLAAHPSTKEAGWLNLSPEFDAESDYLTRAGLTPEHFAEASIPIISYWTPLPGEDVEHPGYAFWVPPRTHVQLSPYSLKSGKKREIRQALASDPAVSRWAPLADALTRGGLPTKIEPDFKAQLALVGAALQCTVAALSRSEWSFQKYMHGPNLYLASEAAREAAEIYAQLIGGKGPAHSWLKRSLLSPFAMKTALLTLSRVAPFDIETYFHVHFTKVEEQMREGIQWLISTGSKKNLPTNYLRQL